MAKNHKDNEYVPYVPVDMNIIDPLRNLPKIKIQGKEIDPRDVKFLKDSVDKVNRANEQSARKSEMDADGFETVTRKSSPEKETNKKIRRENNTPEKRLQNLTNFLKRARHQESETLEDEASDSDSDDSIIQVQDPNSTDGNDAGKNEEETRDMEMSGKDERNNEKNETIVASESM